MITQEINNLIAKIEQLLSSLLNPNLQNDKKIEIFKVIDGQLVDLENVLHSEFNHYNMQAIQSINWCNEIKIDTPVYLNSAILLQKIFKAASQYHYVMSADFINIAFYLGDLSCFFQTVEQKNILISVIADILPEDILRMVVDEEQYNNSKLSTTAPQLKYTETTTHKNNILITTSLTPVKSHLTVHCLFKNNRTRKKINFNDDNIDKQKNSSTKNGYDADIEDNNGLVVSCANNKN